MSDNMSTDSKSSLNRTVESVVTELRAGFRSSILSEQSLLSMTPGSSLPSEDAIARLRKANPVQFENLCKMHLLLCVDLGTPEELFNPPESPVDKNNKGFLPSFMRKRKNNDSESTDKRSILADEILGAEENRQFITLINFLSRETSLNQEGLFRKAGNKKRENHLKAELRQNRPVNLEGENVHDCATVLKALLSELPEPLLGDNLYNAHCVVAEVPTLSKKIKALQILLLLLPSTSRELARALFSLLLKVSECRENKMSADSLGIVFAPNLMCKKDMDAVQIQTMSLHVNTAVATMIEHSEKIFKVPSDLAVDVKVALRNQSMKLDESAHSAAPSTQSKKLKRGSQTFLQAIGLKGSSGTLADESDEASDSACIDTVVTYTDKEASQNTDTEKALAELYAHVHSMPKSSQKKRYLKQFNDNNRPCNSPRHVNRSVVGDTSISGLVGGGRQPRRRTRSVGEALRNIMKRKPKSSRPNSPASLQKEASANLAPSKPTNAVLSSATVPAPIIRSHGRPTSGDTNLGSATPTGLRANLDLDQMEIADLDTSPYLRHKIINRRIRSRSEESVRIMEPMRDMYRSRRQELSGAEQDEKARVRPAIPPPRVPLIKPALGLWNIRAGGSPLIKNSRPVKQKKTAEPVLKSVMSIKDGSEEAV